MKVEVSYVLFYSFLKQYKKNKVKWFVKSRQSCDYSYTKCPDRLSHSLRIISNSKSEKKFLKALVN